jgi:hypothetical protein
MKASPWASDCCKTRLLRDMRAYDSEATHTYIYANFSISSFAASAPSDFVHGGQNTEHIAIAICKYLNDFHKCL